LLSKGFADYDRGSIRRGRVIVNQYIVICLKDTTEKDPATYVQTTRRRFRHKEAREYVNYPMTKDHWACK